MTVASKPQQRLRRRRRVRAKIRGTAERPRLSVFRSNRGVVAQLIDDDSGRTIAAVNWIEPELRELGSMEQAKRVGELIAERAKQAGVSSCVFDRGEDRAVHGLTRSLIANMVQGVTEGFEKRLEIQGIGYRAKLQGKALELTVGYSHPISIPAPDGIEFEVPQPTQVTVRGIDKQLVGETAARIRRTRPPEPYKGKGIRYEGEQVRRKVGKRA